MYDKPEYAEYLRDVLMSHHSPRGEFPVLLKNELHVWTVSIASRSAQLDFLKALLSEEERKRVDYYKFGHTQNSFVVTQAVLRILLSLYQGIKPVEVEMGVRTKGKPYLRTDSSLFFNISNSDDLCVYAFSRDGEVGIDIEKIRPLPDIEMLIDRNLTSREKKYVLKSPEQTLSRFFRFWTYKESYLKAIGEGMRLTPENLEFSVEEGKIRLRGVNYGFDGADWQFREFARDESYTGTLTYAGESHVIREMIPV